MVYNSGLSVFLSSLGMDPEYDEYGRAGYLLKSVLSRRGYDVFDIYIRRDQAYFPNIGLGVEYLGAYITVRGTDTEFVLHACAEVNGDAESDVFFEDRHFDDLEILFRRNKYGEGYYLPVWTKGLVGNKVIDHRGNMILWDSLQWRDARSGRSFSRYEEDDDEYYERQKEYLEDLADAYGDDLESYCIHKGIGF